MNNTINFTSRSNGYLAITKKGWNNAIPDKAYAQINNNRKPLEKYARRNNIKITFTDASNMLSEFHTGSESRFLSGKMAFEVEKKPSLIQKIKTAFSNFKNRKSNEPTVEFVQVPYFSKDSKDIPSLKETKKMGFFVDYEPDNTNYNERINMGTVVDLLQKAVGKKSDKLANLK